MQTSIKKNDIEGLKTIHREIFVSSNRDLSNFSLVFTLEPENFEQKKLGTFFGVIKISDTSDESSYVSNLLASVMKKEYFLKTDRPSYDSFEASLRKANLALAELARQGNIKWIGKINFSGGVIEKNNLHFSQLGSNTILLLRSGSIADIGKEISSESGEENRHPLKTFSDISTGKIKSGDCIIFTTSDLLDIFSLEEIRQNAMRFSREDFPDIVSASLASNSELAATIIANIVPEKKVLEAKENFSKKIPSFPTNFPPQRSILESPVISQERRPSQSVKTSKAYSEKEKREKSLYVSESEEIFPRISVFSRTTSVGKRIFFRIGKFLLVASKKTASYFNQIEWRKIFSSGKNTLSVFSEYFRKIDWKKRTSKILFAIIAFVVVFGIILISFQKRQNVSESTNETENVSAPSAEKPGILNDINAKRVEDISSVASLPADSRNLIFMNETAYVLSNNKTISEINISNGEVKENESNISSGKFDKIAPMPDLNTIFIFTADKKFLSFTPLNRKFQENSITLPENIKVSDIKTYLTYLYVLDSSANQIYRYPRAEGGFGEGQNWLKSGENLNGSDKFAINEDIFAINKTEIIPFLQGRKDTAISLQKTDIPLKIDAVYTEPGFENIYALDNTNHRIVQFSKNGQIAAQYFNDSISGISDFVIDEKNKAIYIQQSNSIQKFSIE